MASPSLRGLGAVLRRREKKFAKFAREIRTLNLRKVRLRPLGKGSASEACTFLTRAGTR